MQNVKLVTLGDIDTHKQRWTGQKKYRIATSQTLHDTVLQRSEWLSMEAAMLLPAAVAC